MGAVGNIRGRRVTARAIPGGIVFALEGEVRELKRWILCIPQPNRMKSNYLSYPQPCAIAVRDLPTQGPYSTKARTIGGRLVRAATSNSFWRGSLTTFEMQVTVIGSLLVLYMAIGSLVFPEGPDQAIFTWIGTVILDGGVPYRDGVDIKGPLTYYIYALAQVLFGRNEASIRVLDLAMVVVGCWLLRRLVLRLTDGDSFGANCAVIFVCAMYYGGGYADTAQPEGWGGTLVLATVVILLEQSSNTYMKMVSAGVLIALATLIKPTFMIYLILPCAVLGTQTFGMTSILVFVSSFGVTIMIAMVCLMRAGALGDFLDVFGYVYTTYESLGHPSWASSLNRLPGSVVRFGLLLPYLSAPIVLKSLRKSQGDRAARLIALWIILASATVVIQKRYWHDHWLPAGIALASALGVACSDVRKTYLKVAEGRPLWARYFAAGAIVGALAVPAHRAFSVNDQWPSYALGLKTHDEYVSRVTEPFNVIPTAFNYNELRRISNYIEHSTAPDQRLVVWGWDVSLFVMSHRKSSTRFGVYQQLTEPGALRNKFRTAFMSEISSRPPGEIIVDTRGAWYLPPQTGLALLDDFPEFKRFIEEGYFRKAVLGDYEVWLRRVLPTDAAAPLSPISPHGT